MEMTRSVLIEYINGKKAVELVLVSLPLLIVVDRIFPPASAGGRLVPHLIRGTILVLMIANIITSRVSLRRFSPAIPLFIYLMVLIVSLLRAPRLTFFEFGEFLKYLVWPVAAISFYQWTSSGLINMKKAKRIFVVLMLLCLANSLIETLNPSASIYRNAMAYDLAYLLPFALLPPIVGFRYALIAVVCAAIVLTLKRGALTALAFSWAVYLLVSGLICRNPRSFRKLMGLSAVVLILMIGAIAFCWADFATRWGVDGTGVSDSSGRDVFWTLIASHWMDGRWDQLLFGFGFQSVPFALENMGYFQIYAHSDWLGTLHDLGLCGIILLIAVHLGVVRLIVRGLRRFNDFAAVLAFGYVTFLAGSLYSGHQGGWFVIYFAVLLGITTASIEPGTMAAFYPARSIGTTEQAAPNQWMGQKAHTQAITDKTVF